jgi:hypothetical protein
MTVKNFASVPAHAICRPVAPFDHDTFYLRSKEVWAEQYLKYRQWAGRWQVDVRATKRAKGISKKTDK